jgi:hypothetical protein
MLRVVLAEKAGFLTSHPRQWRLPMQRFIIALVLALILAGTAGTAEHEDRHLLTVITDDSTQAQPMALIFTAGVVKLERAVFVAGFEKAFPCRKWIVSPFS